MKRTLKDRLMGVIIGIIIGATMVTTAVATTGKIQKSLDYNNIKITLDGKEVVPKDANGKYVEPFAIEGTTYLPVRAISNALGLDVGWDGTTNTVKLTTPKKQLDSEEGNVIYNENGVKVTYTGYELDEDSVYYLSVYLLIENNSSQKVELYSESSAINGFMVDGLMVTEVLPGKKANGRFYFNESTINKNNINVNDIYEIEIQFNYRFNNRYIFSEPIKVLQQTSTIENITTVSQKQSFDIMKNYLINNGYRQDRGEGNILYEYDIKTNNATIAFIYRQKSDTLFFRYDADNGFNNVYLTLSPNNDDFEISANISTDNVLTTYTPSLICKKSDFMSNTSIRFNDNTIPQYNQQVVDEFVSSAVHIIIKTLKDYLMNMDLTIQNLGFTNYG